MAGHADEVTRWLGQWRDGDDGALERLIPVVYGELRRLAGRYLRRERTGHTFQTHDLIHEAFLRLVGQRAVDWQNRAHFFAVAARVMRRILVDHARRRRSAKLGGVARAFVADVGDPLASARPDLVEIDAALAELGQVEETLARIVELRFFGGLEHAEVAAVLGVSEPTVRRRWRTAKAWLYDRLSPAGLGAPRAR